MTTQTVLAVEIRYKHPDETVRYVIDFTKLLKSAETLTGTPTVTLSGSGLTAGSPTVNGSAEEDDQGISIAIGKAVVVSVSGGTADLNYTMTVTCSTTVASQIRTIVCPIYVRTS